MLLCVTGSHRNPRNNHALSPHIVLELVGCDIFRAQVQTSLGGGRRPLGRHTLTAASGVRGAVEANSSGGRRDVGARGTSKAMEHERQHRYQGLQNHRWLEEGQKLCWPLVRDGEGWH